MATTNIQTDRLPHDITISGNVTATAFFGNGAGLTSISGGGTVTANSSMISNSSGLYAVTGYYDLREMFGWVGDGVTNNDVAWANTIAWGATMQPNNQSLPLSLLIPPGNYKVSNTMDWPSFISHIPNVGVGSQGIRNSCIFGYGATILRLIMGGGFLGYNGTGVITGATIVSANAGDVSITATTHANASVFVPGNWMCVTAYDLMGYGYPPNCYYFEYQQILSSNASTGVITLGDPFHNISTPLRNNYRSTFPSYGPSQGGPAYAFCMDPSWDTETEWHGVTVDQYGGQTYGSQRKLTLVNCRFTTSSNSYGFVPTVTKDFKMVGGVNGDLQIEFDKMVEYCEFKDVHFKQIIFQSATVDKLIIDGCSFAQGIVGTGKNTVIRNTDALSLYIGPSWYGASETLLVENSRFQTITYSAPNGQLLSGIASIANGIIKMVNGTGSGTNPFPPLVPGAKAFFATYQTGLDNCGLPFVVLDVTADGSYTYYQTTLPATLPTYNLTPYSNPDRIVPHPCSSVTFRNVKGCPKAMWLSSAPDARPLHEYSKLSYSSSSSGLLVGYNWGNLKKLNINVIKPYTGTTSPAVANVGGVVITSSYTSNSFNVGIDLTQAGLRTITPTAVTGSLGNDVLGSAPGSIWFVGNWGMTTAVNLLGDAAYKQPFWEIELFTDQGITAFDAISGYTSLPLPY